MNNCTKAIIPVAGFGTRRLPITKAIEKCMLPVLNRPVVDFIVEDCIKAGITDIYFVVGEDSAQIRKYYGENTTLEKYLGQKGKTQELEMVQSIAHKANFHYIIQTTDMPYGTTVPAWLCRDLVEDDEKVLIIMGDQFMFHADGSSEAAYFLEEAQKAGTPSAMMAVEVPHEEVGNYGIVSLRDGNLYDKIIDRPKPEEAPTNLNNASFYLFDKEFFKYLEDNMAQEQAGEHMITDALNAYVDAGNTVVVVPIAGEYLDCGTADGWLYANQRVAAAQ